MINCKFCGNENNDGMTHCYICGKPLSTGVLNTLVGINDAGQPQQHQTYHAVNDNVPYGANAQTAARFQSDTGGGVRSGPTQETFGAQMMSGKTTSGKGAGVGTIVTVVLFVAILALLAWYLFFSPYATFSLN